MQSFLKNAKILNELAKGVMSMKTYIYPSVLQKEAIPVIAKKKQNDNIIIRYSSMSGIKLTTLLPILHNLVKTVFSDGNSHYIAILCHSSMRCSEYDSFIESLLTFLKDVIHVVDLYSGDKVENAHKLKTALQPAHEGSDLKALAKARCKILLSTPTQFLELLNKKLIPATLKCNSLLIDKVDMHIALDLSSELQKIAANF